MTILGKGKNGQGAENSNEISELSERVKDLKDVVEKLDIKYKKLSENIKLLQVSEQSQNQTKIDDYSVKENYIIGNISKELEIAGEGRDYRAISNEVDTASDDSQKLYQKAYWLLKTSMKDSHPDFEKAREAFNNFIDKYPQSNLVGNAYYWIGNTHAIEKQNGKAAIAFLNGYKANPKSGRAIDNLLSLARSLSGIPKAKEACSALNKLFNDFPNIDDEHKREADELYKSSGCVK